MAADGGEGRAFRIPRFELLEDRIVLDGVPDVTITGPDGTAGTSVVDIGSQDAQFTLTFDNTGTDSGYVPYVDLIVPSTGSDGDDGVTFDSATFLGAAITTTVLTFDAAGEVEHPFAVDAAGDPFIVSGTPGDTLVVLELPYGSFSPGNPAVDIDITLDFSELADLDDDFTLEAIGGFAFGCDPLDNPTADAPIRGTPETHVVDQSLFEVTKFNDIAENDAATGPSYPYVYTLQVDVADGQTLSDFTLTDTLPPEIVYLGNVVVTGGTGGVITAEPPLNALVTAPNNELVIDFTSISDTVTVTFDYYVNDTSSATSGPVINPASGDEATITNSVTGDGTWDPVDPRDATESVSDSDTDEFQARSIAVQKSNELIVDNQASGSTPGDIYEFTLNVQVSDYFTFGDIVVTDVLGNGWDYVDGSATFTFVEEGSGSATPTSLTPFEMSTFAPGDGTTTNVWNLSAAMASLPMTDGILEGDVAGDGASSGTQTTIQITYQAEILDQYPANVPGEQEISQGDALSNDATVTGTVRENGNPGNVIGTEDDTTSSDVQITTGGIREKEVFAVNGDTGFAASGEPIAVGDEVTFRVVYDAPLGSFEDLVIADNLPQNVFDSAEVTVFNDTTSGIPAAGEAQFGPGDQFSTNTPGGTIPALTIDAPNNGVNFDFSDLSVDPRQPIAIEFLFTVTVIDAVFAPELLLTNQATAFETDSFGNTIDTTAIAQFTYVEPFLEITKGIVAFDSVDSDTQLTAGAGPVAFTAPGSAGARFTGTVSSDGLDTTPIDANVQNVDAGDLVTFAIVVENTGRAPDGAFDVTITDTLPAGFTVPGGGLNLSVTDGTGAAVAVESPGTADTDLFAGGITLVDGAQGAIAAFDETAGDNVIIVTYDLQVEDTVTASQSITNTAAVTEYTALEGSPVNHVPPGGLSDNATATTETPSIDKSRGTKQFDEGGVNEVIVGEEFSYIIDVELIEGTFDNAIISDSVITGGLEFVGGEIIGWQSNLTSSNNLGIGPGLNPFGTVNGDGDVVFDFGTLTVPADNDEANDTIQIRIDARTPDGLGGFGGQLLTNEAEFAWNGGQVDDRVFDRLTEPNMSMVKSATPATVTAGGLVNYSVDIDNIAGSNDAPAFDLRMTDTLDANVTLDNSSIQILQNGTDVTGNPGFTFNILGPNSFEVLVDRMDEGDEILVTYEATVVPGVLAGVTIPNTADLTFDSTPGEDTSIGDGVGDDSDDRDYSLSAPAEVTAAPPGLDKDVFDTSLDDTAGADLAIGEEVTYEVVVTIPNGNTTDVTLTDVLPTTPGVLTYVSSEIVSIGSDISGPTLPTPGASGVNAGDTTTFAFGDLSNPVEAVQDADDEIVVRVTAILTVDAANAEGDALVNTATLSFIDGNGNAASVSDTAQVDVVEPTLDITKTPVPANADAGDVVTYTVTSTNTGGGPAYDIVIDDALADAGLAATGTPTVRILDGATDVTPTGADAPSVAFNAGALQAIAPELLANQTIEIVYQATVTDAALFSSPVPNTAQVTRFDSDPAGDETDDNGRVYDSGLAGYTVPEADAEVQTPDASLTKTLIGSTDPNTPDNDVGVGETVTYELVVTVPQGTADLTLTDVMPAGLAAQSATFVQINNDPGVTSDIAVGTTQTGVGSTGNITIAASGDSVTFDFGTVVVSGENDAQAVDTELVLQVTALVEDDAAVADGATLTNTATLEVVDPGGPGTDLQPDVEATADVDVVEPDVTIEKTSPVGANQGDVVPYSITLQNEGTGPAYDLQVTDTLADPFLSLVSGSVQVTLNGAPLAATVVQTAPDGFVVSGMTLLPSDEIEITFNVLLDPGAPEAQSFPNTATADFDTVDDGDPNSPTGRDDTVTDDSTLATVPRVQKTPFASDLAETDSVNGSDPFQLAVGEEVTFRYELFLAEIDYDALTLVDTLPDGLSYQSFNVVNFGTPEMTDTSDNPLTDPTVGVAGQVITFDFGDIRNPSDGSIGTDDVITFEVTARVTDDAAAVAGATLTNTASLTATPAGEPPLDPHVDIAEVEIVEPLLTIDKTAPLSVARGSDADFSITVVNEGVSGAEGPAYDVVIADTLDPAFILDLSSVVVRVDGAVINPALTASTNSFSFTVPTVDVGQTVTVDYSATLRADATPSIAYDNTATADYTSAPGANPDERSYPTVSDTESVATDPTLTKTAVSGSDPLTTSAEHDPAQLDATIGEEVTYELVLTLPEIPMDDVTLTDTLPAGLEFVSASVSTVGTGITFASNAITDAGQTVTYSFTDVVNPSDGSIGADDQITVLLTARVTDVAANVDGAEITNTSTLSITPEGEPALNPQTASAEIDVVEPELTVDKTGNVAVAPGDTVNYTATFTNTGTAPAYDAFIQDTFSDPFLSLVPGSVTATLDGTDVTSLLTITETAAGFEFTLFDAGTPAALPIEVGDDLVVTYQAILDIAAPEAQSFVNTITADYDTVGDGNPDSPTGRDYTASDDHPVATVPFVDKRPVASTFAETDSTDGSAPFALAIGEEVTFEYLIYLPEVDIDSVVLTDTLPAGLTYQSFNVVNFGVPPMTDNSNNPLTNPDVTVAGQVITFDFGDVRNLFDGNIGPDDIITLQVTALVEDVAGNTAGAALTNQVALDVDPTADPPFPTRENSSTVTIVEPELTVDKSGSQVVAPGDDASYTLTIENTGPAGGSAGPAYDVVVADSFPPEIALNPGSLVFSIDGSVISPTVTANASGFSATIDVLPAGETLTVTYTGTLSGTAMPPESFQNVATVDYDSAPGNNPNERDYPQITDDHRVATPPLMEKTILSTSVGATGNTQYTPGNEDVNVGEEITYQMVITIPEIPADNLTLTDTLPTGLSFVSADIVSVGSEISGVTPADAATVITNIGQVIEFDFGALDNAFSDGVINGNDQIVVTVTARVADIPSVNDGDVLTNAASLVLTPEGEGPLTPVTDDVSVDVVEPDVSITKDVSDAEPQQGDTITYTVTVQNDPAATGPALNVVVTDPLPTDLTLTGTVATAGAAASVTSSSGSTLVVSIPVLQPGETVTLTYDVFVGYATPPFQDVVNTATVTGGTTGDPGDPGRSFTDDDSEIIEVEPVPAPVFEPPERLVGGGIDDERFLPILLIDPIYTGTAEYGANVSISLYQSDGRLSYVRNVVADAGGHWIAIFPRVTLTDVEDDFHQRYESSVLFREPVQYLDDRVGFDSSGAPITDRTFFVGTELRDDNYTVEIRQDRPSILPEDRGMHNARVFFAPATIGEAYVRGDVLKVDEVFENVAELSVKRLYEATVDPLATGLNRFNYEFISEETAIPGGSAR